MNKQEAILKEWEKLIQWFDKVKHKTGVCIADNFMIESEQVTICGDTLCEIVAEYAQRNDISIENTQEVGWIDIHCAVTRVNLQGYLLNQLYEIKEQPPPIDVRLLRCSSV